MYHNKTAFIEVDGIKYFGYEIYSIPDKWGRHPENQEENEFVVDSNTCDKLRLLHESLVDNTIAPPKGSKIYLAPDCPYGIEDVRNNYTIKRRPDTGDYNVLSPLKPHNMYHSLTVATLVIFPSKRIIVIHGENKTREDMFDYAQLHGLDVDISEMLYKNYSSYKYFSIIRNAEVFRKLLSNELTKPCVSYESLNINSENELTTDVLQLVYQTGSTNKWMPDAEKNFIIQLNVLNQHNWREYKGTVAMLFGEMLNDGVYRSMIQTPSRYSKTIQELFAARKDCGFMSEKDFNLARTFVDNLLNIGDCKYTTVKDLHCKLLSIGLSQSTFSRLYKDVVRLTPRSFDNAEKV